MKILEARNLMTNFEATTNRANSLLYLMADKTRHLLGG